MTQQQNFPPPPSTHSAEFLEQIVSLSPDILYIYDICDQKNIYSNNGVQKVLGYTISEITEMGAGLLSSLMHPDDFQTYLEQTVSRYNTLKDDEELTTRYRMRHRNGSWRWLESVESIYCREPSGVPRQIFGVIHDITDTKIAEEAHQKSEQSLKRLVEHLNAGVVIHAADTNIIFASEKASELLGLSVDQIMGKAAIDPAWCFIREDETRMPVEEYPVARVFATLQPIKNMICGIVRPATQDRVWVIVNAFPEFDPDGQVSRAVITFIDISDRIEAELALATEKEKLDEARQKAQKLESLGVLAGGIAHDFNNLLGGILGCVECAIDCITDNQPQQALDVLHTSFDVFERTKGLTMQLLTFAKGGAPIRKTIDISDLIEQSTRFALSGSNVEGKCIIQKNLWPCDCDENQIGQVIDNIVINGQQAMPLGGKISVIATNEQVNNAAGPSGNRNGPFVKIEIQDHGIGIEKNHLSKIFDPFFTTKSLGQGLGLATVYSIVNRHDGWLEIDSTPGSGTTVTVFLPASHSTITSPQSAPAPTRETKGTVLIMDDDQMLLNIERSLLEHLGYQVTCAQNGQSALTQFLAAHNNGTPFSVTILDLTVPNGMGGAETVAQIKGIDPDALVIVASGYANDPIMADPGKYGFCDCITKPFRKEEIAELLKKHVS
ncbi:MAG: PAS domain S-box protein [Deltaproteobacteria bacterium]|nr:PAS domain S-box protein [Deltaproteobacteria bacterium]MBN2672261.1 PAS domain S-box protein [Deltaproteobacteria bacterium]